MTEPGAAQAAVGAALGRFGRIDVLVNNAGVLTRGTALECTDEDWKRIFATNVTAVFRFSRAALREMLKQCGGAIVNVASDWALVSAHGAAAYGASKGTVAQLKRSMALDHAGSGVRVNAVCPGDTDTAMLASEYEGRARPRHWRALARPSPGPGGLSRGGRARRGGPCLGRRKARAAVQREMTPALDLAERYNFAMLSYDSICCPVLAYDSICYYNIYNGACFIVVARYQPRGRFSSLASLG